MKQKILDINESEIATFFVVEDYDSSVLSQREKDHALKLATFNHYYLKAEKLLDAGANQHAKDDHGLSPYQYAKVSHSEKMIAIFEEKDLQLAAAGEITSQDTLTNSAIDNENTQRAMKNKRARI